MDEFIPIEHFNRLLKTWWIIVAAALLGGLVGYVFHRLKPPVYEATAIFYVTIDSTKLAELNAVQRQYDEDIAVSMTEAAMRDAGVQERALIQAAEQNISLDLADLQENSRIERRHAFWQLRFQHPDPAVARTVVNLWAGQSYELIKAWEAGSYLPNYVAFTPPSLAAIPRQPVIYHRNQVVLAGALLGLIAGIVLVEMGAWLAVRSPRQAVVKNPPAA
jgi:hypothetical protein